MIFIAVEMYQKKLNGIVLHRGAILWPRLPFTGLSHGNKSIFIAVNLMAIIICNMISHLKSQQMVIAHVTVVGMYVVGYFIFI